jgi:small subunit ribosomal protein S7
MAEDPIVQAAVEKAEPQEQKAAPAEKPKKQTRKAAKSKEPKAPPVPMQKGAEGEILLFGKYNYNVTVNDLSLKNYINLKPLAYPATFRRFSKKDFSKANINIVERLINSFMRGGTGKKIGGKVIRTEGRLQGKKLKVVHIVEKAFDNINRQTGENPVQVFIKALENSAPIEHTTRIRYGGVIANIAVDISASKRLDMALRNIAHATIIGSFGNRRDVVTTLSNELILAAKNDINSYAVKRKNEIERMARSAR